MAGSLRSEILCGDVLDRLSELPDESVQCVVTSPPYYAQRDYGTGHWEGGDPACTDETLIDTLRDLANYALIAQVEAGRSE